MPAEALTAVLTFTVRSFLDNLLDGSAVPPPGEPRVRRGPLPGRGGRGMPPGTPPTHGCGFGASSVTAGSRFSSADVDDHAHGAGLHLGFDGHGSAVLSRSRSCAACRPPLPGSLPSSRVLSVEWVSGPRACEDSDSACDIRRETLPTKCGNLSPRSARGDPAKAERPGKAGGKERHAPSGSAGARLKNQPISMVCPRAPDRISVCTFIALPLLALALAGSRSGRGPWISSETQIRCRYDAAPD